MQSKILRVIETKEIEKIGESDAIFSDFRLVAATNRNLEEAVAKGAFREDLYHRINILVLKVPPLRERAEDLPEIIQHLLTIMEDKPPDLQIKVGQNVMQLFRKYPWPGNIRELKNVLIFSLISLENGETEIETHHLPKYMLKTSNLESTSSFSVTKTK
ncbi:MAG: sigma 54-interacting transcriptional regulator [Deltaproteobacteria bacterium]|nr:sigma 54-interacting transcriptional regulator [Deltaproteobacteria bacterium]